MSTYSASGTVLGFRTIAEKESVKTATLLSSYVTRRLFKWDPYRKASGGRKVPTVALDPSLLDICPDRLFFHLFPHGTLLSHFSRLLVVPLCLCTSAPDICFQSFASDNPATLQH